MDQNLNQLSFTCFKQYKIKTQVLIIQLVVSCCFAGILTLISYFAFQQIISGYLDTAQELYVQQYYKKTDFISKQQYKCSLEVLFRSQTHLIKSDILYQQIQKFDSLSIQQPINCLEYVDSQDKYQYQDTFCYGFFGDEKYTITEKDKLAFNFSSILTQVLPMLDLDLDLLYSTQGDQMYFSIWPGDPFLGFKPHRRIWYTNHLQQISEQNYNLTYFSDPYLVYTWLIFMITQTRNMTSINGNLDGVFGSDLNLSLFTTYSISDDSIQFSIIDKTGKYLLTNRNLKEEKYVYDTDFSGFSQEDYNQLNNSLFNFSFKNNCTQINQLYQDNRLCRYNSLHNTDELIVIKELSPSNLIMFMQVNLLEKKNELEQFLLEFKTQFSQQYNLYLYLAGCSLFISVIIAIIIIYLTLSPLTKLILYTTQQTFKESELMQHTIKRRINPFKGSQTNNQTIIHLYQAFQTMNHKLIDDFEKKKNNQCINVESIQYPLKSQLQNNLKILFRAFPNHYFSKEWSDFKPLQFMRFKFWKKNKIIFINNQ